MSKEPLRTTRPRVTGVVCFVLSVGLAAVAAMLFWAATSIRGGGPLVAPAAAMAALAVVAVVLGVLALRVAASPDPRALGGVIRVATILAVAVGFLGALASLVVGGLNGSVPAAGVGILVLIAAFPVALQGVLTYGASQHTA